MSSMFPRTKLFGFFFFIIVVFVALSTSISPSLGITKDSVVVPSNGSIIKQHEEFPKLKGINLFVYDWMNWTTLQIDQQISDIKKAGFNFVRTGICFADFYNFTTREINTNSDTKWAYDLSIHFMNDLKAQGLFVSVVPMETGFLATQQNEHWYTNKNYQSFLSNYYFDFSNWCNEMGWTNILYISIWWEASSGEPWHDGIYSLRNSLPNLAEVNKDWISYTNNQNFTTQELSFNGSQPVNWRPTRWYYEDWVRGVFEEITKLKADAVRSGWPGILVGGDIGFIGTPNGIGVYPQFYLGNIENKSAYPDVLSIPSLCAASYIDVIELHDYFDTPDVAITDFLSYNTSKIKVLAEVGPNNYYIKGPDNQTLWWSIVEPKMSVSYMQANGFAYWDWKDYDERPLGLVDINFKPREALSTLSSWMSRLGP